MHVSSETSVTSIKARQLLRPLPRILTMRWREMMVKIAITILFYYILINATAAVSFIWDHSQSITLKIGSLEGMPREGLRRILLIGFGAGNYCGPRILFIGGRRRVINYDH